MAVVRDDVARVRGRKILQNWNAKPNLSARFQDPETLIEEMEGFDMRNVLHNVLRKTELNGLIEPAQRLRNVAMVMIVGDVGIKKAREIAAVRSELNF